MDFLTEWGRIAGIAGMATGIANENPGIRFKRHITRQ